MARITHSQALADAVMAFDAVAAPVRDHQRAPDCTVMNSADQKPHVLSRSQFGSFGPLRDTQCGHPCLPPISGTSTAYRPATAVAGAPGERRTNGIRTLPGPARGARASQYHRPASGC